MLEHRSDRQLRILGHPAVLASLALLALNDFLLRRTWPSWFTGKLGDLAWLFAAPLVVAVLSALLAGALRWGWQHCCPGRAYPITWQLAGAAGFALIGGIFAIAKTIPVCNALVNATAGALFGFPVAWRRDPTDLVALLALLPAWRLWTTGAIWRTHDSLIPLWLPIRRSPATQASRRRHAARNLAWLVVPLSMLLTMADSPQPRGDPGVYCLVEQDGDVIARTGTSEFISRDGGLSWDLAPTPTPEPTGTSGPASPQVATPDIITPGAAQLLRPALAAGRAGLAAPRPSTPIRPASLVAGGLAIASTGTAITSPTLALAPRPEPGAARAFTATIAVTPTLDAAGAAQATLDASPMFIPRCAPKNPIVDPDHPQVIYRYHQEDVIERSQDGGQTWIAEYYLRPLTDGERQTYSAGHHPGSYGGDNTSSVFPPRPLDALFDPASGNALFAMGQQGVLVRAATGQWWWATLGRYRYLGK